MGEREPHIRIHKWDELQHYKDREPPWIKLYNRLLDHYEFGRLPDAAKGHYVGLLMLRSRRGEPLPLDVDWLATRINATTPLDLRPLVNAGLIEVYHSASRPLAQDASMPQAFARSREAETEAETESTEGSSLRSSPSGASPDVENSRETGNRWGETVTACRDHLWLAEDPPRSRSVREELSAAKQICERWNLAPSEIPEVVEGFAQRREAGQWEGWVEPGEPATLLALNRRPSDEQGIPAVVRCLHEVRKNGTPSERDGDLSRLSA